MSAKADKRNAEAFERRVAELIAAGFSAAQIAKQTGKSYTHTSRIVSRIKELGEQNV